VFNEKLSLNNIAKVEGYLAHKYGLESNLKHKDDDGSGSPNIYALYDYFSSVPQFSSFGSSTQGWDVYLERNGERVDDVTITYDGYLSYMKISTPATLTSANLIMKRTFDPPIEGSAYPTFLTGFFNHSDGESDDKEAFISFVDTDGTETILYDEKFTYTARGAGSGAYTGKELLLTATGWINKKIKSMKFSLGADGDGNMIYNVSYIHLYGNSHPHPYGEYAPLTESSNSWNLNY